MKIRRVVTGHNADGKATVASDTRVEGITVALAPGMEIHRLWGADEPLDFPDEGKQPPFVTYFPRVGGFRFGLFTVPPETEVDLSDLDIEAAQLEFEEKFPGMLDHVEPDNPGMHTTNTIDYEYVISGEVWLELDDGEQVHLKAGDTVVQNGTRHAWRNKSNEPCQMVVCLVGANRIAR
jgi:mannose-6-phosphate isomerase-like protein (cupin superfamily)